MKLKDMMLKETPGRIEVNTDKYMNSHGKEPRGIGNWFFLLKKGNKKRETGFNGKYSVARSKAVILARKEGFNKVYTMP